MWTVLPISSICILELHKDRCSCVPDVSVFTCSTWNIHIHMMERAAPRETCLMASCRKSPGLFLGYIIATQKGCHCEILGIIKCLSNDWCRVYSLCKKTQSRAHAFQATFFKSSLVTSFIFCTSTIPVCNCYIVITSPPWPIYCLNSLIFSHLHLLYITFCFLLLYNIIDSVLFIPCVTLCCCMCRIAMLYLG